MASILGDIRAVAMLALSSCTGSCVGPDLAVWRRRHRQECFAQGPPSTASWTSDSSYCFEKVSADSVLLASSVNLRGEVCRDARWGLCLIGTRSAKGTVSPALSYLLRLGIWSRLTPDLAGWGVALALVVQPGLIKRRPSLRDTADRYPASHSAGLSL